MTQHVFLKLPEVKKRTGQGKTAIYRGIKQGEFPKQVPYGNGRVAWLESEIHRWQEEKINQR
jgi:prophage regulatory protein